MPLEPIAITTFCDDIRYELGGKHSLIGVYRDSLVFTEGAFPITIPKLALSVTFIEHPTAPVGDSEIVVLMPGLPPDPPAFSFKVPTLGVTAIPDAGEHTRRTLNFHIMLGPLTIKESGPIKVRLINKGKRHKAGTLTVRIADPKELEQSAVAFAS